MTFDVTKRTELKRLPERGRYDRAAAYSILDEALVCHVGFVEEGQPFVIPTIHARDGDALLLHGSSASRMLRTLRDGVPLCVTVTLVDELVLARSVFNHSMNYRSVVILGVAREITDEQRKLEAMEVLTEHVIPGRWADIRHPNDAEFKQTRMLELPLEEASVKVRTGPPGDEEADYDLDVWAGVVPYSLRAGTPQADPRLKSGIELPSYLRDYRRS